MFADDRLDSQWHAERAQIAFGAGGLMGAGFLKGEQKAGGFVPEQHNDFIFTVIGEEGGLIGTATIILLFCGLLYRIWYQTICADDNFQQLLLAGIFSLLAFQTFVNIGMNLSLLPVVGLWLPFISYGGSAMFLCMACIGLVLNIGVRSQPSLFS
jgi:rod shape determining protein RodA